MRQLKISKSITNRSSEALDKYLVEIGREPMVSIDEEIELAQKIRKGGREGERAKEKLVKANLVSLYLLLSNISTKVFLLPTSSTRVTSVW